MRNAILIEQTYSYKLQYYILCILQSKVKQIFWSTQKAGPERRPTHSGRIVSAILNSILLFNEHLTFASFSFLPYSLHLPHRFVCTSDTALSEPHSTFSANALSSSRVYHSDTRLGNFSFSPWVSSEFFRDACTFVQVVVK